LKNKQISESDFVTNKILLVFSISLIGVLALMMIYKLLLDPPCAIATVYSLQILSFLSLIGFSFGVYRWITETKKQINVSRKLVKGKSITVFFGILFCCCVFIVSANPVAAVRTLYIVIPGFAVFYLIRAIYIREFFILSEICAAGALVLWGSSKVLASGHVFLFPFCIGLGLLSALGMVLILRQAQKNKGVFEFGHISFAVMDKHSAYKTSFITLAILAVLLIVSLFVKAQLITYFSFAVLSYLFIMAVYYTIKLM